MFLPANWVSCLALVEWWYNSGPYSSIQTSLFELLYGHLPLLHLLYLPGDSESDIVQDFS